MVGAGTTGSRVVPALAAADVGLVVIDRDYVEETDVKRGTYPQEATGKLKAEETARAAEERGAEVKPIADHLSASNAAQLLGGANLVLDCTDNWRTRALINEYCWQKQTPWVYCGAIASKAMCSSVVPKNKPCWLCWNQTEPRQVLSCSKYGITAKAAETAAKKAVEETKKILAGKTPEMAGQLFFADVEKQIAETVELTANRECAVCARNEYRLLEGREEQTLQACGTNDWLFLNTNARKTIGHYALEELAKKLATLKPVAFAGAVRVNAVLGTTAAVFQGGRTLVRAQEKTKAIKANEFVVEKLLN